ncbi:hypothetical protein FXO37_24539 [Capsicum annuum]|nr:hypothetical protein FXO37_24539 [Capsicum annuum]
MRSSSKKCKKIESGEEKEDEGPEMGGRGRGTARAQLHWKVFWVVRWVGSEQVENGKIMHKTNDPESEVLHFYKGMLRYAAPSFIHSNAQGTGLPVEDDNIDYDIHSNCELHISGEWIVIKFFQATALQNGVKEIVYGDPYWFTPTYRFPIIKVLAGKSLPELVLSGCDLMAVSLFSGAVHCQSLRKFSLYLISQSLKVLNIRYYEGIRDTRFFKSEMASKISMTNADGINNAITIVQFNPVTQLPIKLTGNHNFFLWKAQVSMLMRSHNLYGHLNGSNPDPTRTISQNNQDVDNPEFIS